MTYQYIDISIHSIRIFFTLYLWDCCINIIYIHTFVLSSPWGWRFAAETCRRVRVYVGCNLQFYRVHTLVQRMWVMKVVNFQALSASPFFCVAPRQWVIGAIGPVFTDIPILEDETTTLYRHVGHQSPTDAAQHTWTANSSTQVQILTSF
jgi:hypothetical protein